MKNLFFCKLTVLILSGAFLFSGCAEIDETPPEVTTEAVTEASPYPVTIGSLVFNISPETAASLSPAMTEIICELGFRERLTGRSVYCSYPEEVEALDTLGSAANPDAEAIITKAPQLLISHSPIAKKDITAIENAGTRVLIISAPNSVEGLRKLYEDIYRVFNGKIPEETEVIDEKFTLLENVFLENKDILGSYAYILSPELAAASDETFAGDFFSHFGKNAAAESGTNSITAEELLEADPNYIIFPPEMSIEQLPEELSELTAVNEGRVITLSEEISSLLERPTSRIYLAAEFIAESASQH